MQAFGIEGELHIAVGVNSDVLINLELWNLHTGVGWHSFAVEQKASVDFANFAVERSFVKGEVEVAHECLRSFYEQYIAGDTAVVEPVGHFGRDVVSATTAIHADDEEVALFLHEVRHFVAEWSESAFVASESLAVECNGSDVVGSTDIYEVALVAVEVNLIERAAVPDVAFVVHQFWLLGVPTARHP